ncbi:hypothetical protein [Sedimenticola thiotaurini]|uniref:VWA domain-containing protein n=1 Tax=Sedimenticola thiotaurini TaxID=1543721 RepID=A0A0F7K2L0_9GAMM|nr:hypothetical protein [Sedimenticola thiotaurini]AKH21158.1 hypothetical protein AAY24_13215 [Sedimenticola thiotaurini]
MAKDKLVKTSNRSEIDAFLKKVATTPVRKPTGRTGRLIFAMDATASREPTWDHACHIQAQMFEETAALGGLSIQLCFYRGFNEFSASDWLSNKTDLQQRMLAVHCLGGHTQIRKVLRHAIRETREKPVDAVVFVGDCLEEEVDELCQLAGELALHNVPVFLFQEGNQPAAKRAFKQIARLTDGAYCPFDASSAQQLRDLLSAVAVYAAGGRRALENFSKTRGGVTKLLTSQINKG